MANRLFRTTSLGTLPAGTDIAAALVSGEESALFAVWITYHHNRFTRGVVAELVAADLGGEETEQARDVMGAELDGQAEVTPAQALEANRRLVELLVGRLRSTAQDAREGGASWAAVGAALGMSEQGALDWYNRKVGEPGASADGAEAGNE